MGNTFGRVFRITTFGESHGPALGCVIDGCPAGIELTEELVQVELDVRKPGNSATGATARKEADRVKILSGVFAGVTTGTPIAMMIENQDHQSADYGHLATAYRPGHADYAYDKKFGMRDYRGGGRSSGRETAARVAGGAVALLLLKRWGIEVSACTVNYGGVAAQDVDFAGAMQRPFFAANDAVVLQWQALLDAARAAGDTIGGAVQIAATGVPAGFGEPVFDKLDAMLAHALMSVGTVKAVEIGAGCAVAAMGGIENNDLMLPVGGFASNNAGGILGGISTGQTVQARAWVKPIASVGVPQETVDKDGNALTLQIRGRHDVSAIPRIVPVLKSMVALTLADALLLQQSRLGTP